MILCRLVRRHHTQPQLPACHPPPRILPPRRQGPQPHPRHHTPPHLPACHPPPRLLPPRRQGPQPHPRHHTQPQLPACHPPPRILPPRRQGPQPHPRQHLPLAACQNRRTPLRPEGRDFRQHPSASGLRHRPLPPPWPRGRRPRYLAPFAPRHPHRQTFQPPTRFGRGHDRCPRSRTCFQTRHLPCPSPRYPQQHALRTPPSRCPFRG